MPHAPQNPFDAAMRAPVRPSALGFVRPSLPAKRVRRTVKASLPDPRFLNRGQAASYVGVGEHVFALEVAHGYWPAPTRRGHRGGALRWDRAELDRRADERAGLLQGVPVTTQTTAEARALEHIMNGGR